MTGSLRPKIARSKPIKAITAFALLGYIAFLVTGSVRQKNTLPWEAQGDNFSPWRDLAMSKLKTKLKTATSEVSKEQLRNQTQTGNQTENVLRRKTDEPKEPMPKCAKTLRSLAKYSKWFHAKFQPNVKLFLDKADINNYSHYLTRGLPYGFKSQNHTVFDQILRHENFTNPPIHGTGGKRGCKRCAVIGSGGILNGSGAGEEIDGHDYVFRVNRAISKGRFAKDVGRRTTFYTFFPESQRLMEVEDQTMIAFYAIFKAYDVAYALKIIQQDKSPRYTISAASNGFRRPGLDPRKLKIIHPAFFNYVTESFLGKKARPTTGSIMVILSLHICDEVTIYGFGYDPRFSMHYYDGKFIEHTRKATGSHDVENERKLWMKLHEEGVIRLFKRDL